MIHDTKVMTLRQYNQWIVVKENANRVIKLKILSKNNCKSKLRTKEKVVYVDVKSTRKS